MCFAAKAIAYSATTVFPAEVWAATNTLSPISRRYTASFWKLSSSKGYYYISFFHARLYRTGHTNRAGSGTSSLNCIVSWCSGRRFKWQLAYVSELLVDVHDMCPFFSVGRFELLSRCWRSRQSLLISLTDLCMRSPRQLTPIGSKSSTFFFDGPAPLGPSWTSLSSPCLFSSPSLETCNSGDSLPSLLLLLAFGAIDCRPNISARNSSAANQLKLPSRATASLPPDN
jgi:hypothetical protein